MPYEAQEVRAFGLFLADMLARIRGSSHPDARQALSDIKAACLLEQPRERPPFKTLAARQADIEKVLVASAGFTVSSFCRSTLQVSGMLTCMPGVTRRACTELLAGDARAEEAHQPH